MLYNSQLINTASLAHFIFRIWGQFFLKIIAWALRWQIIHNEMPKFGQVRTPHLRGDTSIPVTRKNLTLHYEMMQYDHIYATMLKKNHIFAYMGYTIFIIRLCTFPNYHLSHKGILSSVIPCLFTGYRFVPIPCHSHHMRP